MDVRSLIKEEYELCIFKSTDSITAGWEGGKKLAHSSDFKNLVVNKKVYEEYGQSICKEKFEIN